ncbi:MAG TPA: MFS transporter [Ktedonobacterales bacterium]|nr:MFS transporter [Ktedonobacterales bacterium]
MSVSNASPVASSVERADDIRRRLLLYTLLIVVGANLRTVILAVPPVLPLIRSDLGLSYTEAGILTALPTLLMGGTAWFSGLLAERIGGRAAVTVGLALLAFGAIMRAVLPDTPALFAFTIVLSLGIALAQTSTPTLIKGWFPRQIGFASAIFTDGLIIGETISAGLTVPLMLWLLGKDAWTLTFIFWGVLAVGILFLWLWLAPSARHTPITGISNTTDIPVAAGALAVSGLGNNEDRRLAPTTFILPGLLLGCGSLMYFAMNTWIASYNQAIHAPHATPPALATLNALQLPASLGVTFFAQRLAGKRWPFVLSGAVCFIAIVGWVSAPPGLEVVWASLIGAGSAFVFALGLALPPLLATPAQVARLTGLTLTLSYTLAFVGPLVGGVLWDAFGAPSLAFLPVAAAAVALIGLSAIAPLRRART